MEAARAGALIAHTPVIMFGIDGCPYCNSMEQLLSQCTQNYTKVDIVKNTGIKEDLAQELKKVKEKQVVRKDGTFTVPQLFINGVYIGGFSDLNDMLNYASTAWDLDERIRPVFSKLFKKA